LDKYPHLKGTVLERPEVISDPSRLWAPRMDMGDRCEYVAGNMFEAVPNADAYFMKLILHDWNDDECVQILKNQYQAANPEGRIFLVEHVTPGPGTPHFSKLFDIHMMCWGTGRERTQDEYVTLLQKAGWTYQTTWF